jgi:ribonuclease Z
MHVSDAHSLSVRRKPVVTRAASPGTEQGSPKRARQDAPPAAPQEAAPAEQGESVCYLCEVRCSLLPVYAHAQRLTSILPLQLADVPGKFDPAKAAALGVTPGPTFGRLVRGESVTVADGSTVQPCDVVSPASPGPVALIVDVPTLAHLSAATAHPRFLAPLTDGRTLGVVVHLTPHDVASTPEYTAWAASLLGGAGGAAGHIMASPEVAGSPVVMRSSARLAGRLTLINPDIFPPLLLAGSGTAAEAAAELVVDAPLGAPLPEAMGPPPLRAPPAGAPKGALVGENLLRWKLRPLAGAGADREAVPAVLPSYSALRSALAHGVPEAMQLAATMRAGWAAPSATPLPPALQALVPGSANDAEVVFLGTGAAIPSKYRNVSGILVQMPGRGGCILDCGEGTLGQLRRRYGAAGADALLASLRLIWISHIHADHHVGIISLLAARRRVLGPDCEPICVVGPWPLRAFLGLHSGGVEPLAHRFLDLAVTTAERQAEGVSADAAEAVPYAMFQAAVQALGLQRLHSVRVIHCAHSYGAVLESAAGLKIVYSGDTRPCPALVEAAKGATLLIHEATFEDALIDEARAKKHSATHEALATGAAAGAFRTLLTHFSQRYPKIPVLDDSAAAVADSTAIAFDLMRVRMSDLAALPRIMPPLRALFDDPSLEGADEGEDAPVA